LSDKQTTNPNLKQIIAYVNGKTPTIDRVSMLAAVTITATSLAAFPVLGATASTAATLLGKTLPEQIKKLIQLAKNDKEQAAMNVQDRCRFVDVLLAKLAVFHVTEKQLTGTDKLFAQWKIANKSADDRKEIEELDYKREKAVMEGYQDNRFNKEGYWDQLIEDIITIMEIEMDDVPTFTTTMQNDIRNTYEAFKKQVILESEFYSVYSSGGTENKLIEILQFMKSYGHLYSTIDEMEQSLRDKTEPAISLKFFNYKEKSFEESFLEQLSQDVIYVKGKTREEVVFYILYILKYIEKQRTPQTYIIDSIDNWNALKGKCQGKILIPNFSAAEVDIIPNNTNIIAYSEEDYVGNRSPIELKKRIIRNMREQLQEEINDVRRANEIIGKSSGLFTTFKRIVFKGKMGLPKWQAHDLDVLIPALLVGSWTDSKDDLAVVCRLAGVDDKEYMSKLAAVIGGEDPYLLKYTNFGTTIYKLANVEEAWEILFKHITAEHMNTFRQLIQDLLLDVPPKFDLPIEDHFQASIFNKSGKHSDTIKKGIIRTLIMIANMNGIDNNFNVLSTQSWVDDLLVEVFKNITTEKKWFAISETLSDIAEASPEIFLSVLEREVGKQDSQIWQLFEQTSDGFGARNYYTNVLWGLEKLLCLEDFVPRAVRVLAKLSERDINYPITNSPFETLCRALLAWYHDINISINEKIQLTNHIVKTSTIGWELLTKLLPDRSPGHTAMSMSRPYYRNYNQKYELKYQSEVGHTYKSYMQFAIREAAGNLKRWAVIFEKCFFFELGLEKEVIHGVQQAIDNSGSDQDKYFLKETVRELIHNHRYFIDAEWSLDVVYVDIIERKIFDKIVFQQASFDYLYLFKTDQLTDLHPDSYKRDKDFNDDFQKQYRQLKQERVQAMNRLMQDPDFSLSLFLSNLDEQTAVMGLRAIGSIMAADIHDYQIDLAFVEEVIAAGKIDVLIAYMSTIYEAKGFHAVKDLLGKIEVNTEITVSLLSVAKVNDEFLEYLSSFHKQGIDRYWKAFTYQREIKEKTTRDFVFDKLLTYQNFHNAFQMLHRAFKEDVEKHILALEHLMYNPGSDYQVAHYDIHYIVQSFKKIYEEEKLNESLHTRVCALEWRYFNVLVNRIQPKYLKREIQMNPSFLAQLVSSAYKASNQEELPVDRSEAEQSLSRQAWNILFQLEFCPCLDDYGNINVHELTSYTEEYLKQIDFKKREDIGRQTLGKSFAYSPKGEDDIFPMEAVREVFELYYSEELKRGFYLGKINQRGAYFGTEGKAEQELALRYEDYARALRIEYPRLSQTLKKISDQYRAESIGQRELASYDL
jgi:hypothetical protein